MAAGNLRKSRARAPLGSETSSQKTVVGAQRTALEREVPRAGPEVGCRLSSCSVLSRNCSG